MKQGQMTFTGTLIEDLIATVERVEDTLDADEIMMEIQPWLAINQENTGSDSKFLGVA